MDKVDEIEQFAAAQRGKFRRHSSAVLNRGMNGFHRRPVELYLVRLNPACRAVWLYMLQVGLIFLILFFCLLSQHVFFSD